MKATDVLLRRATSAASFTSVPSGLLQRKCDCGTSAAVGGTCDECRKGSEGLQRKATGHDAGGNVPHIVHDVLRSPGAPLDTATRGFYESRFNHDFSGVRVHTDGRAAASARAVDSYAYTVGNHVVFGSAQFSPSSNAGRELLAHELTHVVQQSGAPASMQSRLKVGAAGDASEHEADRVAAQVMRGEPVPALTTHAPLLSRRVIHSGRILNEGDCEHLACNSKWACEDDTSGVTCPTGTRNDSAKTKHRYRPLFTCDTKCENGVACGDTEHYMAIPFDNFARRKCGQDLVICANGSFTHASLRDRSERAAYEVSPAVLSALGITSGDISNGAVYGDEKDADFLKDKRCRTVKTDAGTDAGSDAGTDAGIDGGRDAGSDAGALERDS